MRHHYKLPAFKIILVGEAGVGKSALMYRYLQDQFTLQHMTTVGVEFASKIVKLGDSRIKLEVWDTAGQQKYRSVVKNFYRNSSAVLVVYNPCIKQSFYRVESWLKEARDNCRKSVITILIATHIDLIEKRQISLENGEQLKQQLGFDIYCEVSSLTGIYVQQCFQKIAERLLEEHSKLKSLAPQIQSSGEQLVKQPPTCWNVHDHNICCGRQ